VFASGASSATREFSDQRAGHRRYGGQPIPIVVNTRTAGVAWWSSSHVGAGDNVGCHEQKMLRRRCYDIWLIVGVDGSLEIT
jgi:hypothetical protein